MITESDKINNDDNDIEKIDLNLMFSGNIRSNLNKLSLLLNRLRNLFEENEWKTLKKKSVIQILELEGDLDRGFIKENIEEFIKDGTLHEPKQG